MLQNKNNNNKEQDDNDDDINRLKMSDNTDGMDEDDLDIILDDYSRS